MLFVPSYPSVLAHDDLSETNILMDDDGRMGLVDWQGARILSFGKSLYGLDNLLELMDS